MNHPSRAHDAHGSATVYAEHPLNVSSSDNIRLIKIRPKAVTADSHVKIEVEIETVALKDAPPYTALSYVWGTVDHPDTIVLGGQHMQVRTNLWNFLDTIQRKEEADYFWIDALCIDQGSNSERSHQVAMMGQIYSKATKVIVWLGSGPPELLEVVRDLERGRSYSRVSGSLAWELPLVEAEYWRRVWIIQEFVLAKRLEIRCSDAVVASSTVAQLTNRRTCYIELGVQGSWILALLKFRNDWHWGAPFADFSILTEVIYENPPRPQCADVRDRIFAVLSLVRPDTLREYPITVNYDDTPSDLLVSLVERRRVMIRQGALQGPYRPLGAFSAILMRLLDLRRDERALQWRKEIIHRELLEPPVLS